ncbi:MAG: alpha/beta hydrolase, partial [Planctomycetota bacterium]
MALFQITCFSKTLGKENELIVLTPDAHEGPMRVVYQLHGHGDCASTWLRQTCLERYAKQNRVMLVLPDGGKGWYTDACTGQFNCESHILETITFVDQHFNTVQSRCARGIGGIGMGGYGALKLALKHPELFGTVAVHSANIDLERLRPDREPLLRSVFGDIVPEEDDCFRLAERLGRMQPMLHLDCGTRDELHPENLAFHQHLKSLDIPHRFAEYPGGHSWSYWEAHLPAA